MEISQLKCFIAVAEELHFNRAAVKLNMTQPPLSRQIQLLERSLGCKLFIRTSRSVIMTEAGRSFLADSRRILELLKNARNTAKFISLGQSGTLRCGFTAATAYKFLPSLIRQLGVEIPGGRLDLREMVSARQTAALDTGEIDIGLLRAPVDTKICDYRLVAREKMILVLPEDHPLGQRKRASWQDLDGIDFITYDREEGGYLHALLSVNFARRRIQPNFVQKLAQVHSILLLVRAGVGAAIVPESARVLNVTGVVYREFTGQASPSAELLIAWRKTNQNPLIASIARVAESLVS